MKIYTGRYANARSVPPGVVPVAISVGVPRWWRGKRCDLLTPFGLFRKVSGEAFQVAYLERLDNYGPNLIRQTLENLSDGADIVLLCWEDIMTSPCHRRYFAEWWEAKTGEPVKELLVEKEAQKGHPTLF